MMMRTCGRCGIPLFNEVGHNRAVGMEVTREYRGVLYWFCPDCGWSWQTREPSDPIYGVAQAHIDRMNSYDQQHPTTGSSTASGAMDGGKERR